MKTLMLGYGNPGRGDDGLGPALVEALAPRFPNVTALTAMQLQPEHGFDLEAHDLVLVADAGVNVPPPFTFEPIRPRWDASFSTHALSPWMLLAICRDTLGKAPPPTFLLTLAGERFGLGEELSPAAHRHLQAASVFASRLLADPDPGRWRAVSACGHARAVPG